MPAVWTKSPDGSENEEWLRLAEDEHEHRLVEF